MVRMVEARREAIAPDLAPLVTVVERNEVAPAHARRAFRVSYCRWWTNGMISADELLRQFVPAEHDGKIVDFRDYDEALLQLSGQSIRSRIGRNVPARGSRGNREYSDGLMLQSPVPAASCWCSLHCGQSRWIFPVPNQRVYGTSKTFWILPSEDRKYLRRQYPARREIGSLRLRRPLPNACGSVAGQFTRRLVYRPIGLT